MSQPQQPSQPAAATAPGPIDQKDIEYWSNQMNSALADFNGTVNNKSPAGASQWANGFFSCFNPIETCLLTWCCPCVTFGR